MIFGNQTTQNHLQKLVDQNQLPQTILLSGPAQIGKTTILKAVANKILPNKQEQLQSLWQETEATPLKIKTIRDLQKQLQLTTTSHKQLVLIKNIERLTLPAANALLKTLEEPPAKVHFLLTTSCINQLLPTIISRCQVFNLSVLTPTEAAAFTQAHNINIPKDLAEITTPYPGLQKTLSETNDTPLYIKTAQMIYRTQTNNSPNDTNYWNTHKQISDTEREVLLSSCQFLLQILKNQNKKDKKWATTCQKTIQAQKLLKGNIHKGIIADLLLK